MKKFMIVVMVCLACGLVLATEQERRLEYADMALGSVATMRSCMGEINGNWNTNVVQPFVGGVANTTVDLAYGPAYYNASVNWEDASGFSLFNSYGGIKKIEVGMNYMDFSMYLSYWRYISVKLPPEVTGDSDVWVNGAQAWFDGQFWMAAIAAPWNVTSLTILWGGHGQWVVNTNPSFDYGQIIPLNSGDMDSSITVPAQAYGISYIGELSWPDQQVVFVSGVQYDQSLEANVLVCYNTLYKNYGSFRVMITLQNYDPNLGNSVQYFSRYLDVTGEMIMIPLINNNGQSFGIPDYTQVKFVYEDPSDGGLVKQQWDNELYTVPYNGGGLGKGSQGQ